MHESDVRMHDVDARRRSARATQLVMLCALLAVPGPADGQGVSAAATAPDPLQLSASNLTASPTIGLLPEPWVLTEGINFAVSIFGEGRSANGRRIKAGWYPELSNKATGAGFVSIGPGYRLLPFDGRVLVDLSSAVSWHFFKMAQTRVELLDVADGRVSLGAQLMWQDQTQIRYFGIGAGSVEANESLYRLTHADLVGYAAIRPADWLEIGGEFGWLPRPNIRSAGGTFKPDLPDASQQFPDDPGMSLSTQPSFIHGEASVTADTLDYPSHPTSGGLYRGVLTTFKDQADGTFSFLQYEAQAMHVIPVSHRNWVLALRGWLVASDVPGGHDVPFYLLPSLGGHNTLRGYSNYRFHDRNLLALTAESRFALFEHLDGAVFVDAGNVAPRASDLNVRKVSYGAGLRLHSGRATFARVDLAYGGEGWNFVFRTSEPLRLSRASRSRRTAVVPFAP
jgi:hypothetical protein